MVLHWGLGVLGSLLTLRERVPWRGSRWCLGRGEKETAGLGRGLALQCALVALKPSCTGRSTRQRNHCAAATPGQASCPRCPRGNTHSCVQPSCARPGEPVPQPKHLSPCTGFAASPLLPPKSSTSARSAPAPGPPAPGPPTPLSPPASISDQAAQRASAGTG